SDLSPAARAGSNGSGPAPLRACSRTSRVSPGWVGSRLSRWPRRKHRSSSTTPRTTWTSRPRTPRPPRWSGWRPRRPDRRGSGGGALGHGTVARPAGQAFCRLAGFVDVGSLAGARSQMTGRGGHRPYLGAAARTGRKGRHMTDDCNQGDFTAGSDDPTGPMPEQSAETGPGGGAPADQTGADRVDAERSSRQRVVLTGISSRAWEHPADRGALTALRELRGFDEALKLLAGLWNERAWRLQFLGGAIRVDRHQYPRVYRIYSEAAAALDVRELPELYVQNDRSL